MALIDRTPWRLSLDREDTAVLKALAMAGIVAHSFLHQVSPAPLENEFNFYGLRAFWRMVVRTTFGFCLFGARLDAGASKPPDH